MPQKILVTGGAGYIGSHTVIELAQEGYEPVIIDNFSNSNPEVIGRLEQILGRPVKCYTGNVEDRQRLREIFEEEKDISGAIHFAAYKAVGESVEKPLAYYNVNLGSTLSLLEVMLEFGAGDLVFSSSCTVYGEPDHLPVTEESPRKPAESPYGNTKQMCEDFIRDTVTGRAPLKGISLRYFNPVGAHPSALIGELPLGVPANLVPFITQTAAGIRKELTVFGSDYNTADGSCIRDYIHVVDLARAHVSALEYLEKQPEEPFYDIFNVGVGRGYTVLEVINAFEKVTGNKLNYSIGDRRTGDIEKIYADTTKSEQVLGWHAKLTLEDALKDAWQWQQTLKNE
ncbi:MAG: UDP-glucose 4-epimerase GalE [Cyclobacteriaceae bacterium]|nr:UDP-glucose 4-epimerase GalE [Cyclobacteriaceae bacterium]